MTGNAEQLRQQRLHSQPGPGRPPIGPPLPVRLPPELRAALDARAEAEGVKVTELIRQILAAAV